MKRPSIIQVREPGGFYNDLKEFIDLEGSNDYWTEVFIGQIVPLNYVGATMHRIRLVLSEGNNASVSQRYQE